MTREDVKDDKIVQHFFIFVGKDAFNLLKTLGFPDKPISLPYATIKEQNVVTCGVRNLLLIHGLLRTNLLIDYLGEKTKVREKVYQATE